MYIIGATYICSSVSEKSSDLFRCLTSANMLVNNNKKLFLKNQQLYSNFLASPLTQKMSSPSPS